LDVWTEILDSLKPKVNPQSFATWLQPCRMLPSSNSKMRIQVPNAEFEEMIASKWAAEILKLARDAGFHDVVYYREFEPPEPAKEPDAEEEDSYQPEPVPSGCPQLPEEAWPEAALQYREAIHRTTNAPDSFHLACFLTCAGAAFGRRIWTTVSEPIFPSMFTVLVGASGISRKGTSMKKAMRVFERADVSLEVVRAIDTAEGLIRSLVSFQGKDIEEKNRRPAIFHLSELRTFLNKAGKKGLENVIPRVCEALDGDKLESRSLISPATIPEPFIAGIAGSSKPYVKAFNRDDLEGGLGRRMIFIYGEPKRPIAKPPRPKEPHCSNVVSSLRAAVRYWQDNGPYELSMDKKADELWVAFFESELPKYLPEDEFLRVIGNGADHCCAKTALIAAGLSRSKHIREEHLKCGIAYAKYAIDCLRFVFDEYDVPRWVRDERKILESVRRRREGILRRRLQHNFKRLGASEFNKHIRGLLESKIIGQATDDRGREVLFYVEE
jgi:hypothetical protein